MSIFNKYARVWNDGKLGFGKHSYNDAKLSGISNRELSNALAGTRIGKVAQENISSGMGTSPYFSQYARIWDDNRLGFGQHSYNAAIGAGVTNQQLQQGLSGYRVGKVAADRIKIGVDREKADVVPEAAMPEREPPVIPDPKTLTTAGSAVGGNAAGVKIKRSNASKKNKNSKGTQSLNRASRNTSMKISNLNLA